MIKLKFKLRVKFDYYYQDRSWYKIQYCSYRIIPIWHDVFVFNEFDGYHTTKYFTSHTSAVMFAKRINSFDDLKKYHDNEIKKYYEWKRKREEIYNRNKPMVKTTNRI